MYLYIAARKLRFLTHVQACYENKTFRKLMKASFPHVSSFAMCTYLRFTKFPVPMRLGETPVPIPNTTVKT